MFSPSSDILHTADYALCSYSSNSYAGHEIKNDMECALHEQRVFTIWSRVNDKLLSVLVESRARCDAQLHIETSEAELYEIVRDRRRHSSLLMAL